MEEFMELVLEVLEEPWDLVLEALVEHMVLDLEAMELDLEAMEQVLEVLEDHMELVLGALEEFTVDLELHHLEVLRSMEVNLEDLEHLIGAPLELLGAMAGPLVDLELMDLVLLEDYMELPLTLLPLSIVQHPSQLTEPIQHQSQPMELTQHQFQPTEPIQPQHLEDIQLLLYIELLSTQLVYLCIEEPNFVKFNLSAVLSSLNWHRCFQLVKHLLATVLLFSNWEEI
jgi:hypothetical protein